MKALYIQTDIISKLKKAFYEIFEIFSAESTPTREHLFDLLLSVLCLNGFSSVNYNFEHFIQYISDNKLKSYYFTLNESKINLSQWMKNIVRIVLTLIPEKLLDHLIILSIDDTNEKNRPKRSEYDCVCKIQGRLQIFVIVLFGGLSI